MNTFYQWAVDWNLSQACINDFIMRVQCQNIQETSGITTETDVNSSVRLKAAKTGMSLWRNNSGAFRDNRGRMIRFGLGNDSKQVNEHFKTSDLIGIKPIKITPKHIGKIIGQFVARECKKPGWKFTGTEREKAQGNFLALVAAKGGDALFTTGEL